MSEWTVVAFDATELQSRFCTGYSWHLVDEGGHDKWVAIDSVALACRRVGIMYPHMRVDYELETITMGDVEEITKGGLGDVTIKWGIDTTHFPVSPTMAPVTYG